MARRKRTWSFVGKSYTSAVIELPDGSWLGAMGLNTNLDPHGTSQKQATFTTAEEALRYVGYPIDFVAMPDALKDH